MHTQALAAWLTILSYAYIYVCTVYTVELESWQDQQDWRDLRLAGTDETKATRQLEVRKKKPDRLEANDFTGLRAEV